MKIVKRINLVKLGFRAIDFLPVNLVSLEYKSTEKKWFCLGLLSLHLGRFRVSSIQMLCCALFQHAAGSWKLLFSTSDYLRDLFWLLLKQIKLKGLISPKVWKSYSLIQSPESERKSSI